METSRKTSTKEIIREFLYADDLAVVADSEADLQERLVEWNVIFCRYRLRVSLGNIQIF